MSSTSTPARIRRGEARRIGPDMAPRLTAVLSAVAGAAWTAPLRYLRSEWAGWRTDVGEHPRLFAGLAAVAALQAADSSTFGATARLLRQDLSLSHGQIGLLSSVTAFIGLLATLPAGMAADRWSRVRLLRIAVVLWAVGMAWIAMSSSLTSMAAPRALLGAVNAAAGPITASLIGDTVPIDRRGRVYGRLVAAQLIGSGLGVVISGELAGLLGWRWGYWWLAAAAVGILVALRHLDEPRRRPAPTREGAADVNRLSWWQAVGKVLSIRTNVALIVASASAYYFLNGISTFGFAYLHARFGISQAVAPLVLIGLGGAAVVGALSGARFGDRLMREGHPSGRIAAVLVAVCGAVVCIVPALSVPAP
ncbi:MAG TPA: MFS transporter, partial [Jatrophihabitans sp.]|nr:MFS transporter [Jatrophihabitans sp.]